MSQITIECPDDILRVLQETPDAFVREARLLIAAKLYETGRLTSGQVARFAGLERLLVLRSSERGGGCLSRPPITAYATRPF